MRMEIDMARLLVLKAAWAMDKFGNKEARQQIAALGGQARRRSLEVARRIADNFNYLHATDELRGPQPRPARVSTFKGPLPGLYPTRS